MNPLVVGYDYTLQFQLLPVAPDTTPVVAFPAGAAFRAQFRTKAGAELLFTATTGDATLVRVSDDTMQVKVPAAASKLWTMKKVQFDLARTDTTPDRYLPVVFEVTVVQPITVQGDP